MRELLVGTDDDYYIVECAVRADGSTSPVSEALARLRKGEWRLDEDHVEGDPWPDERQPDDYFKLLAHLKHFVQHGEPLYRRAMNYLVDGVWEWKIGSKRIPMFDTDDEGNYEPKAPISHIDDAPKGARYWEIPDFDYTIRLTHMFPKTGPKAPPEEIQLAKTIREEDVEHDRPASPEG
ncbi:hypothetical protein ACFPER_08530 [Agromyces aurantiacus]|uniref:DUF3893 domain-containing protein n=1 Tax=Agromyces aurantiacus TaxID=165814 RepID=A0ABV9R4D7_9MICO|nr:hypothetical protein [Agromyces aurantiacus]MBM7503514.1 hypothetical protein [Agromyces aurantiacus]